MKAQARRDRKAAKVFTITVPSGYSVKIIRVVPDKSRKAGK